MTEEMYKCSEQCGDWWWSKVRRKIAIDIINDLKNEISPISLLDIGAGNGVFLQEASKHIDKCLGLEKYTYEPSFFDNILHTDLYENTLEDGAFNIITFFDVLEHNEDDSKFLIEVKRLLNKENGHIILIVPAYQWLFSNIDVMAGHYRRYNAKTLKKLMNDNGFEIKKISYLLTFLFPIFALSRIIYKIFGAVLDN